MSYWRIVLYSVAAFVVLQVCYMVYGCAGEMRKRGPIPLFWWPPIVVAVPVGLVLDLAFNFVACLMFLRSPLPLLLDYVARLGYAIGHYVLRLDLKSPHDRLTFSERVAHEYQHSDGWRWKLAAWWRRTLNAPVPGHID